MYSSQMFYIGGNPVQIYFSPIFLKTFQFFILIVYTNLLLSSDLMIIFITF